VSDASTVKRILVVGAAGAAGGVVNGWLCFAGIPVPVRESLGFDWLVVPGGALHGAILALLPVVVAVVVGRWSLRWRTFVAPAVGWTSGYFSWIPLHHLVFGESMARSLAWPWAGGIGLEAAWKPFAFFGLVSLFWYLVIATGGLRLSRWQLAMLVACAGAFGSLWFWTEFDQWYLAGLHGTIWGVLVGWAATRVALATCTRPAVEGAE